MMKIKISIKKRKTLSSIKAIKPLKAGNSPQYIVSLTTFGKRLTNTAPYAIITLLNQSVSPDRIVLWVGNNEKENVPDILYRLKDKGLEIKYCEDIRSYKKLIPSLELFPNDYIITTDDDVYYPCDWFEQLLTAHKKNTNRIICFRAHRIVVDINHNPLPYTEWEFGVTPNNAKHQPESVFPTGVGGILYPPGCFHKDVTDKELFIKLAPYADDIWFWAMAIINKKYFADNSPYVIAQNKKPARLKYIEQNLNDEAGSLWRYNSHGGNDTQLKSVIERYPETKDTLRKINPL